MTKRQVIPGVYIEPRIADTAKDVLAQPCGAHRAGIGPGLPEPAHET